MSVVKINQSDVESFTIVTNPLRHYVSSSTAGSTGSVFVFPRRSDIERDFYPSSSFVDNKHDDASIAATFNTLQQYGRYARVSGSNSSFIASASQAFPKMLDDYMNKLSNLPLSARKQKSLEINRFTPSTSFTSNTVKKLIVKDVLDPYYVTDYPSAHWAYTNFNSLNFFTSSTVPTSSCMLYPNVPDGRQQQGFASGTYTPSGAISFDFYVNPRYKPDSADAPFKAGTIFHLSSTYALSLVSGTAKDENGKPLAFRLQLQLSHSADVAPSKAVQGTFPNDLIFLSDDNLLPWNEWHHVVVRWGTDAINQGTGSFNVDGLDRGKFVVPSGTIVPKSFTVTANPDVLVVGNYYEGTNTGNSVIANFFAADPALRDGLRQLVNTTGINEPTSYAFNHPLNAELHDLTIRRSYVSDSDIQSSASFAPKKIDTKEFAMYVPVLFVESSSLRQSVAGYGGILQTPFFEVDGTTTDPFNVALSFGVAGHYMNIENFVKDFATQNFPRLHHMTGVAITTTTNQARTANDFLYDQPFVRRRNTFITPCDDGKFVPAYELLASESSRTNIVDDLGVQELSFVHMGQMLAPSSSLFGTDFDGDSSFVNDAVGFTPETPGSTTGTVFKSYANRINASVASGTFHAGLQDGAPLPVFERTLDPSSNQVTFFDVSNLYYGKRILPGSLVLKDTAFSGSGGAVSFTLKDDGRGTLYRSDCFTSASTWNAVGTVFYSEGIIAIKSPHLYFFGKEGFDISFRGEQNVHVMHVNVIAPANVLNSSSNPNFVSVPPSPFPNDPEKQFVYVSTINLHDEHLNVVMKTQLAQPIMKRPGDKIMFKVKFDT